MTEVAQQQWTYDEVAITMAQHLHAYAHNNGPDLEAEDLAIPCDAFSIEKRKAKWTKVKRDKLNLIGARFEALRPKIEEAKRKLAEVEPTKPAVAFRRYDALAKMASFILPAPQPVAEKAEKDNAKALTKDDRAVAPEIKRRAMLRFNPAKNPFNQNGFENARIALDLMEFDCALDLFHHKPVIRGKHAWLGGDGFEDLDNVVLKLRQLILDEFGFDPKGTGSCCRRFIEMRRWHCRPECERRLSVCLLKIQSSARLLSRRWTVSPSQRRSNGALNARNSRRN